MDKKETFKALESLGFKRVRAITLAVHTHAEYKKDKVMVYLDYSPYGENIWMAHVNFEENNLRVRKVEEFSYFLNLHTKT